MNRTLIAAAALALTTVACGSATPKAEIAKAPAPGGAVVSAAPATAAPLIEPAIVERSPACDARITVYFPLDVAQLATRDQAALQDAADCLRTGDSVVRIEGHADPRGTEDYNLGLAERRAQAVARYLTALGVPASRLAAVSYGEIYAKGDDPASWTYDRRAEIQVGKR